LSPRCRRTGTCGWIEVDGDAELIDQAASGHELESRARFVSVGVQGPGEQHPRLSGFVWGLDFAPNADPLLKGGDRLLDVAAMERQLSARDCCRGRRSRGAEPSRQLLQLRDALGRRLLITHRHTRRDVDR
jgi:hypothetical protein